MIAIATVACGDPEAQGNGDTTSVVASFGEDGPTSASQTTGDGTSTTSPASTTASTTAPTTGPDPVTSGSSSGDTTSTTTTGADASAGTSDASSTGAGETGAPICASVQATIRDFSVAYVDMTVMGTSQAEPGLVLDALDAAGKPIYNPDYAGTPVITSADTFAQWYTDVPDVNNTIEVMLDVYEESPGRTVFADDTFFPIDDLGFGNEGEADNFYFTTEIHTTITYSGGEVMNFGGDDDVWVFIAGHLAVDLGGRHGATYADIALDDLGLEPGQSYALDVFHAERGVQSSVLRFELGAFCPP